MTACVTGAGSLNMDLGICSPRVPCPGEAGGGKDQSVPGVS